MDGAALPPREDGAAPLIAPALEIFDTEAVDADIEALAAEFSDPTALRAAATMRLRAALEAGRARIQTAFHTERCSGRLAARSICWLTDRIVLATYRLVTERLHRLSNPTTAERIALAAVGGYGRGEMAPFSDVDLLFVTPYKLTAWSESVIETMLFVLWDLKLKVGPSTRNVEECLRLGRDDITIRTALLEKRHLAGDRALFDDLAARLWDELFSRTGPEFVEAKLAERDERHKRTGGSRYLLEPNVKESKGGLRDLQTLYWIAKSLYRAESLDELTAKGVFTAEEAARCRAAATHLWTVRCGLHYAAGRAQEKLTFDYQLDLAERFGYRATQGQRPVERFMKRYFLAAKEVGDLTRIFCAALEQQHKKSPPLLGGLMRMFASTPRAGENEPWLEMRDGRLNVSDPTEFERRPLAILETFEEAIRVGVLIHPATLRLIDGSRRLVDDSFRADPKARSKFLDLLTKSKDPTRALRRMSETGVLGRFVPEFGRVIGLMQYNMYHHYTVDEHTIMAVDVFGQIASGAQKQAHPIETGIAEGLADRRVMTVALFLHDIGKGLPEDHSVAGERIARRVCPELGMTEAETEQVAWLTRWHLLMSDVAQKRDVTDPATVRAFAEQVRSPARLKLLYLLTVCDIRAVGPGVWNGWKAQLLRQLYQETWAQLTGEDAGLSRGQRVEAAEAALRAELPDWSETEWLAHSARFFPSYWLGVSNVTHLMHARMMAEGDSDPAKPPIMLRVARSESREATKVAFYAADHSGLFARLAGAFALAGETVMDARVYTTKDGMAINTFWIRDTDITDSDPEQRAKRLTRAVERALSGEVVARDALRRRRKLRQRERGFDVAPRVSIGNDASETFTVIEVNGRDRVGLLHDLARALTSANVNIFSAIVATYGEHAVDVFYVRDLFGMKITQASKQKKIEDALLAALVRSGEAE